MKKIDSSKGFLGSYLVSLVILIVTFTGYIPALTLALVDITGRDIAPYHNFLSLALQAGFNTNYYGIDQVLDAANLRLDQDLVFFVCGSEFLVAKPTNSCSKKVLQLYQARMLPEKTKHKTVNQKNITGLVLPNFTEFKVSKITKKLLQKLDLNNTKRNQIKRFLYNSSGRKSIDYHTSLRCPSVKSLQAKQVVKIKYSGFKELPSLLAAKNNILSELQVHLPLALYKINQSEQALVLMPNWVLTATSINENFLVVPCDQKLRVELDGLILQMLVQLKNLLLGQDLKANNKTVETKLVENKLVENKILAPIANQLIEKDQQLVEIEQLEPSIAAPKITVAWMSLTAFEQLDESAGTANLEDVTAVQNLKIKTQQQLVQYILAAKFNRLWLGLSPQMYVGKTARYPDKKLKFYQAIRNFYTQLKAAAQAQAIAMPDLYIGFEIANNLYEPYLPKQCVTDLFGNSYPDLPAPLDYDFWQTEILEPLASLIKELPEISWSGITLDFEMYLRDQASEFSDLMGLAKTTKSSDLAASYKQLIYQAEQLAGHIKTSCQKIIPNCQIMSYMPKILTSWFYEGMLRGLSSAQAPIYLMSFNTEYLTHKWWFEAHDIYVKHLTVLLLSKFATPKDFALLDQACDKHDGVWFNRWSRLVEPYEKDSWTAAENTLLSDTDKFGLAQSIRKYARV